MGAKLTAFLSMVDRRKALHRHLCEWALQHPEFFHSDASTLCQRHRANERSSEPDCGGFPTGCCSHRVRYPVVQCGGKAGAFRASGVVGQSNHRSDRQNWRRGRRRPLACAFANRYLGNGSSGYTRRHTPVKAGGPQRTRLRVAGAALSAVMPSGSTSLSHIFDTEDGVLLSGGYLLELLEDPGALL